jgi:hypothetical protein
MLLLMLSAVIGDDGSWDGERRSKSARTSRSRRGGERKIKILELRG